MRMRGGPDGRWRMDGIPMMGMMRGLSRMPFIMGMMRGMPTMGMVMRGGFRRWMLPIPLVFFGMLCCVGFVLARAFDTGDFRCLLLPFCCLGGFAAVVGLAGVLVYMVFEELSNDEDEEKAKNTIDGEIL